MTLIFFGILVKMEYATDTYSVFNFNADQIYVQFASSGRFITALIGKFIKQINMPEIGIYVFSYILAIICMITSQYKLYKIIEKSIKKQTPEKLNTAIHILLPTLIIINPFSIELFLFIEKGIMVFSILMCIYGIENVIKFFEDRELMQNKLKYLIYATIFMFIANASYQGIVGIFVSILLVYVLNYSKSLKQFIYNNFIVILIYGIPAIIDYLLIKLFVPVNRLNGQIVIQESLKKIQINLINITKGMYNLLPKYVFIFVIIFIFIFFCYKVWNEKKRLLNILKYIYIIIGVTFIAVVPQIMQPTNSIWFVPRATYCFASLYGILILYLYIKFKISNLQKAVITIISVFFLFIQLHQFIKIEQDRYILNGKDYQVSIQIIEKIKDYEKETGNEITEISIYEDKKINYTYDGIFSTGDINIKCYANDWSTVEILKYYLGQNLQFMQKEDEIAKSFLEKDWNEFNNEQIIFKENKLNLCKY